MNNTAGRNNYQMKSDNDKLIFRTTSFKAEKTSVLHSGVYTKEFSSMLFASAVCIFSFMISDFISSRSPIIRYVILVIIFIAAFLGANSFIFKERYLEAVFDKTGNAIYITRSGLITRHSEKISLSRLRSIEIDSKKYIPENVDGIDFVQKISAQHGSAVPGLSDIEEFITLTLKLTDGTERIIYAAKIEGGKVDGEPYVPVKEIRSFLDTEV